MKDKLVELLETFGYPVHLQGSLTKDEAYPESFFTFWDNDSYDKAHYDNHAISYVWDFDINFYSTNPTLVNNTLIGAKALLVSNGFIISGKGYDVASDEPEYTGRGMHALYVERETGGNNYV